MAIGVTIPVLWAALCRAGYQFLVNGLLKNYDRRYPVEVRDGGKRIFRRMKNEENRYGPEEIFVQRVRGPDLGSTVEVAMRAVNDKVKLPQGYTLEWAGEYESQKRANHRLAIVIPLTLLVITLVLYSMCRSFKWGGLVLLNLSFAPLDGWLALLIRGEHFSVPSGIGFLALFGVSV